MSVIADSMHDLERMLAACTTLGLRDVTITTVPLADSTIKFRYHLDACRPGES